MLRLSLSLSLSLFCLAIELTEGRFVTCRLVTSHSRDEVLKARC